MTSELVRGSAAVAALLVFSAAASADPPVAAPAAGAPNQAASPGIANPAGPAPEAAKPDVATLLFGTPQWNGAPPGAKLRYAYEKTVSDAALGSSFKDEVVLTLGPGDDARSRTTEMQLFSGVNRKPAGPFPSDGQNPVLLVVLEDNVQELSRLFKANPRYLKNAIRKAWRDDARIEPAQDTIGGKPVAVTRITVAPFVNDAESDKMKGLQTMTYVVDIAKDLPGAIAAIDIRAPARDKPLFAETLRFGSETKP